MPIAIGTMPSKPIIYVGTTSEVNEPIALIAASYDYELMICLLVSLLY
jgi:hypothetical protein